ncbi:MAG: caspase family protein [Rhodovibrionaceae bacterium]
MRYRGLAALWLGAAIILQAAPLDAAETDSAVYVELRAEGAGAEGARERWKLYGASHALVIGIDDYSAGWPRLSNAVRDAEAVAAGLKSQGFEVELLRNPGSQDLRTALRAFFARKGADPEARLFLWYAGHGHTEYGEGYLVPSDAPLPGEPDFAFQALHLGDVGAMVRIARAKHVFAVFDSCFAGTIFNASRARPPAAITRAVNEPVRQFLTSGDADQEVSDDGTFRDLFLRALTGKEDADANDDGYLTGTELSLFLEDRVINLTQSLQTPRSGKLRDRRFDQGDFVFLLPGAAERQVASAAGGAAPPSGTRALPQVDPALAVELAFWQSIQASSSAADYKAYLASYPEGQFRTLAEARLADLTAASEDPQLAVLPPDPAAQVEAALDLSHGEREEVQRALTALGYDTKGVDGAFGPGTRGAIGAYQAAKGLEPNGYLTASLFGALMAETPETAPQAPAAAALPSPAAITAEAFDAYLESNRRRMKGGLVRYNERHKAIVRDNGSPDLRPLRFPTWVLTEADGDEALVAVGYLDPDAGTTGKQRFLFRWTGTEFEVIGHEENGEIKRAR